eukprot:364430-Chlamydomonas_euryale.AAC.10
MTCVLTMTCMLAMCTAVIATRSMTWSAQRSRCRKHAGRHSNTIQGGGLDVLAARPSRTTCCTQATLPVIIASTSPLVRPQGWSYKNRRLRKLSRDAAWICSTQHRDMIP